MIVTLFLIPRISKFVLFIASSMLHFCIINNHLTAMIMGLKQHSNKP